MELEMVGWDSEELKVNISLFTENGFDRGVMGVTCEAVGS